MLQSVEASLGLYVAAWQLSSLSNQGLANCSALKSAYLSGISYMLRQSYPPAEMELKSCWAS